MTAITTAHLTILMRFLFTEAIRAALASATRFTSRFAFCRSRFVVPIVKDYRAAIWCVQPAIPIGSR